MIWVLGIMVILLIVYLLIMRANIKSLKDQMTFVLREDTAHELRVSTNNKQISDLALVCNELIRDNKQLRHHVLSHEQELQSTISNIIHDLRTPLTVASGYVQIVTEAVDGSQKETLTKARTSMEHVSSNLENLYALSRIQEKHASLLVRTNVSDLVMNHLFTYFDALNQKGIDLEPLIETNIHLDLNAQDFNHVLDNLLGNILAYGTGHAQVCLNQTEQGTRLQFKNQTTYPNINTEDIFNRFYTQSGKGTGLGLYIVRELLHKMNAKVIAEHDQDWFIITITF